MADCLSTDKVTRLRQTMLWLSCAASQLFAMAPVHAAEGAAAAASALPDPTRPPAVLSVSETKDDAKSAEPPPAGLQTVIVRNGAKPLAIINGQSVELGGKVGDARLVRLSETEAVLQGPNGKSVLHLLPQAERKPVLAQRSSEGANIPKAPKKTKSKLTK